MLQSFASFWPQVLASALIGFLIGFLGLWLVFRSLDWIVAHTAKLNIRNASATALFQGLALLVILAGALVLTAIAFALLSPSQDVNSVVPRSGLLSQVLGIAVFGWAQRRRHRKKSAL